MCSSDLLPRESFKKGHRSLIITTRYPQTLQVVKHEAYIVKKTKISAKGKNHKSMKLNKLQLNNVNLKSARVYLWKSKQQYLEGGETVSVSDGGGELIPLLGGQPGEELVLGPGGLERWDHQTVVRGRPKVAGGGVRLEDRKSVV